MQCTKPLTLPGKLGDAQLRLVVPCGKCLACRINRRTEWSARMLHELENHDDAIFITLTYDEEHVPDNQSLRKADLVLFFKRLRKSLSLENRRVRYFACGEYGDQTQRPHYHAIVFGMSLRQDPKIRLVKTKGGRDFKLQYLSGDKDIIKNCWTYCDWNNRTIDKQSFGLAEKDSIRYVAQYIDKKFSGDLEYEEYTSKGREPVFRLMSQGIGRFFCDSHADQLSKNLFYTINGVKRNLPRYYVNRLGVNTTPVKIKARERGYEFVKKYTGLDDVDLRQARDLLSHEDFEKVNMGEERERQAKETNTKARIDLKVRRL